MLLGDGGSLLIFRRNARSTETPDSCFRNCNTQNAFCSRVAIIALLRHRPREKRGVGLRMPTKLEHMLFRSMWETYFCVCFESRNGRLNPLQLFCYTLCYIIKLNGVVYYIIKLNSLLEWLIYCIIKLNRLFEWLIYCIIKLNRLFEWLIYYIIKLNRLFEWLIYCIIKLNRLFEWLIY